MNRWRRLLILPVIFLYCVFSVNSQTMSLGPVEGTIALSPETAVEMALRNNLNLESARIGIDIMKRRSDLAWNQVIDSVGVAGNLSRENVAPVQMGMTLPSWRVNGAFSASLYFSFALFEGMRSLRLDYEAGLVSYEKARLQMEQAVRKMYNTILLMQAYEALLQETYENARRQANMAEANFRAGLAPRLTLLQAQVAVENLKPTIIEHENSLKLISGNFALLLGLDYDTVFELQPVYIDDPSRQFIPPDLAALISRASVEKPDIQELRANIMTLNSQRNALVLQQYTPFLRLGWSLASIYDLTRDPFQDGFFTPDNWNRGGSFTLTLGMSFNSFLPFTREAQQRKDMQANIDMQYLRLSQMIRETELEIYSKINSLESIRTTAEAQRAAVDMAVEAYRLTEEAYRAGLQDFQSVESSALALHQARFQLLNQQFNYLNDLIDLEYAIGVPFGTLSNMEN